MNKMTPAEFEQVLHPIFQEDELTLILAGKTSIDRNLTRFVPQLIETYRTIKRRIVTVWLVSMQLQPVTWLFVDPYSEY